jgi:hypothetical protein
MESVDKAALHAVLTGTLGLSIDTGIDLLMEHAFRNEESNENMAAALGVQLAINGVAVFLMTKALKDRDYSDGVLFFPALLQSQPSLQKKLKWSHAALRSLKPPPQSSERKA